MRHLLLLAIGMFFTNFLLGQREQTLFSDLHLSGAWGNVTYNFSSYDDNWHLIRGGSGGLEFGRNVFLGWGGYRVKGDVALPSTGQRFDLKYNGFLLGLNPMGNYRAIHPRLSILFGGGRVDFEGDRERVTVFQPAAGLEINVFQWFRLGLEGGYRMVLNNDLAGLSNRDVSAPFMQLDLRFGFSWGD